MSTALIVRIIGGVYGAYIAGKIYDIIKPPTPPPPSIQAPHSPPSYKDAKSFEELLNIEIKEEINKNPNALDMSDYDYDNEIGNTFDFDIKPKEPPTVENHIIINDALYDCTFYDVYMMLGR